jgi:hypothetical protein
MPKKKAGEASRGSSEPIVVKREVFSAFFDRSLRQASIDLGIYPTALKSLCRKHNRERKAFRRSMSVLAGGRFYANVIAFFSV